MIASISIPFDEFSSFMRGPALGPAKIHEAFHSDSANYFTERGTDLKEHNEVVVIPAFQLPSGMAVTAAIETNVAAVSSQYDKILTLGGDHSITYPVVKAVARKFKNLSILHIDAHPDLYDVFDGNKFSHACPFARIMEEGLAQRLVQVGIRTMAKHQREQADRFGVEVVEMKDFDPSREYHFEGPVYISLDIDAIDPAFAPGVSHHEPGGFTTREVLTILQRLKANVVAADIVEFNPLRDPSGITAMLAAKLYKEMLDVLLRSKA
ncbi:MAG TPA: agmatinase [Cyclobacteriaceae bacterium]|nr:agmatinase [Cyclobacteriaceae bacterium]